LKSLFERGVDEIRGHLLYDISDEEFRVAAGWLERAGVISLIDAAAEDFKKNGQIPIDPMLDKIVTRFLDAWEAEAGLKTYGQAVADVIEFRASDGEPFEMSVEEWMAFAKRASLYEAREKARSMGIRIIWDCERPKTPEGYYQLKSGIDYAIAKSLGAAPFADILWMETKTADLDDAREFAHAIHAEHPEKMLAYNLSPSFNWDTTGMSEEEMKRFPEELGSLGYVFNFITYGGHQVDGLASEEFATALKQDGMLALARLQRKIRFLESPYRTPQTLVGGPRLDAALMASTGRTATTKAMGKGSTQFQHLVQTEVPTKLLAGWLGDWAAHNKIDQTLRVLLRSYTSGSELLELSVFRASDEKLANVIFAPIRDRREQSFLSIRDQNNYHEELRQKRLMTLLTIFLIHRYKAVSIHYVTPTEDNHFQAKKMKVRGIFSNVYEDVGQIIVAEINQGRIEELVDPENDALENLITKTEKQSV
jgi:isocitrate lyase